MLNSTEAEAPDGVPSLQAGRKSCQKSPPPAPWQSKSRNCRIPFAASGLGTRPSCVRGRQLMVDLSIKFVMDSLALQQHGSFRVDRVYVFYLRNLISTSVTWRHLGLRFESDYWLCNQFPNHVRYLAPLHRLSVLQACRLSGKYDPWFNQNAFSSWYVCNMLQQCARSVWHGQHWLISQSAILNWCWLLHLLLFITQNTLSFASIVH